MTKTELQVALAAATETNNRTAGVFLETLSALAYKEIKKTSEFVVPGFGKLVKQKRKARTGFNPKTQQKIKIPAKTVVKFRVFKVAKDSYEQQIRLAFRRRDRVSLNHRTAAWLASYFDLLFAANPRFNPGEKRLLAQAQGLPTP